LPATAGPAIFCAFNKSKKEKGGAMGRIKVTKNKNLLRPKKTGAARTRRVLEQRKRLVAAGVTETAAKALTDKEIRAKLKELKV